MKVFLFEFFKMSLKSLSYNLSSSQEPLQFSNYVIVVFLFILPQKISSFQPQTGHRQI